ncbi:MAG: glutamate-1-semialdehyde 2,1-aminomutase [Hyphomicrobium sp.]|nr:MAG: glutamate-1-semialdehyde 2,1-aminomutase [Hyphomicrobium sp.]PPD01588.1 MAG: glutamate-1-semialdehyde 2,1-aminomutase [Hyphomicrobium sp.]
MPDQSNNFSRSRALREKAHHLIPGGAHTYAKGDDQFPELAPGFIARGSGSHVWDIDGNEFIEYGMGLRAVTLGHAHKAVLTAVARELSSGCNFTRPSPLEVECAETLLDMIPAADMAKFCKDGSAATSAALKIARAYTGRDHVAICAEHPFFSTYDWFMGTTPMNAGVPDAIRQLTLKFHYNDLSSVSALFSSHPGKIACLMLEPSRLEEPHDGFLDELKRLCHANGALLVFDETITGFRWHNGGGQTYYNVAPDLSCFGKALANGFSVSALAGKREYMRLGGIDHTDRARVFLLSTTHGAETHSLAAAIATMHVYQNEPVIEALDRQGRRLKLGLQEAVVRHGLQRYVQVVGKPCCQFFNALDRDGRPSQAFRTLLMQETIRKGILAPSLVVSYAHSDDDIARTVDAFDNAFSVYVRALSDGVEQHLVGRPTETVYRAFNSQV